MSRTICLNTTATTGSYMRFVADIYTLAWNLSNLIKLKLRVWRELGQRWYDWLNGSIRAKPLSAVDKTKSNNNNNKTKQSKCIYMYKYIWSRSCRGYSYQQVTYAHAQYSNSDVKRKMKRVSCGMASITWHHFRFRVSRHNLQISSARFPFDNHLIFFFLGPSKHRVPFH